MALARRGHTVTILERDPAPPEGDADSAFFHWQRNGAAQFRHPHAFLGVMCGIIEDRYPALLEELNAAGARRVDFPDMLPPALKSSYQPEEGDEKLWVLLCRRATMETVIRRYVASLAGVTIYNGATVTGIVTSTVDGNLRATGLEIEADGSGPRENPLLADIVIDASGRTSRFPRWLQALGRTVREEKDDAEIVYFTRHYRLMPGETEPPRGERAGAGDLGYLKYGVFPGERGHFAIILCVPLAEIALRKAVRDNVLFDRICLNIPGLEPWLADGRSESTTEPFGIGDIQSVWRHYLDAEGKPLMENFFTVGDSALRTNPLYGRGCSTSIMHAEMLAEILDDEASPSARAQAFDAETERALRPIFLASLREDRNGIRRSRAILENQPRDQATTLKKWFALAFGDALGAAVRNQLHVLRGMLRTFHLLEIPGEFLKDPRIRRTVLLYMLRGRKRNARSRLQAGPDRAEMLELLALPDG